MGRRMRRDKGRRFRRQATQRQQYLSSARVPWRWLEMKAVYLDTQKTSCEVHAAELVPRRVRFEVRTEIAATVSRFTGRSDLPVAETLHTAYAHLGLARSTPPP